MRITVLGGGPAGLYFSILTKTGLAVGRHHGVRAQPRRRHVRLRRRVLRPDARNVRKVRQAELPGDHRHLRLLGRRRGPLQGHHAPGRRQRLLRLRPADAADAAAGTLRGAGREAGVFPGRVRPVRVRRQRPDRRRRRHQLRDPRPLPATTSSRRPTCGPTASPGWDRPGRSTPSPSRSAKPRTASSSPMPTSTSRAARPG